MRFAVLGSGSGGNSAIVDCGEVRLLVDAGLSAKQLSQRLEAIGVEPGSLSGILLTHEHGDHVRGLNVFLKKFPIPVYTTPQTAHVVREGGISAATWKTFESGQSFAIGGIRVQSFAIQHDAIDPVGFVIADDHCRMGFVSDAGFVTRSMTESLRGLHGLFLEANYDERLLENDTKRPWATKQRISSRHGHLSNDQAAGLLCEIAHAEMSRVVLGHLSSDCNHPELAIAHMHTRLKDAGHGHIAVHCAVQHEPTAWFAL